MSNAYPITRYLSVAKAYRPSFSADGQRLAFLSDITGIPQIWEVLTAVSGGHPLWPEQRTFENNRIALVQYAPRGDRLLYARDFGGNENMQLFILAADNTVTHLTAGYEDAMHIFGSWSEDGTCILFAANRRHPALFDLYVQTLGDTPSDARLVWQNDTPGYLRNAAFSPDGERVIFTRVHSSFNHALFEIDYKRSDHTGAARHLLADHTGTRYPNVAYGDDGHNLWLNTDLGSDFLTLGTLDLSTDTYTPGIAPAWDCSNMTLAPDRQAFAYTVNVNGADELHYRDLRTGNDHRANLGAIPGVIVGHPTFAPTGDTLAYAFTSATHTHNILLWNLKTNSVHLVTQSSHGGLPTSIFQPPTLIHYPTFDKDADGQTRTIPAWYYAANGEWRMANGATPQSEIFDQKPAIIMVHGGPEGQFRPNFNAIIQYFLQRGYAVLAPNVRGSVGYGKAYSYLDDVEKRMDSVADLAHAATWLREQPGIDADRIVVYGGSYGGFMVLSAMTEYPDLWAAGVDIVGVSNFVTFLENTSDYRRAHREAEYGSLAHNRDFLTRISPANHLEQLRAPLVVIHGANDPRVPLSEAEQVVAILKARAIPVEFIVFDDEGHGIVKRKNKLVAYPAIADFLDKHLKERSGE